MKSEFYEKFLKFTTVMGDKFKLRGKAILIELLEEEEIKIGNTDLILATDPNQVRGNTDEHKARIGLVLAVGDGYYDDSTGETIPIDVPVGAIVSIPRYSTTQLSTFPGLASITRMKLGIIGDDEVIFYYENMEAYQRAREVLN